MPHAGEEGSRREECGISDARSSALREWRISAFQDAAIGGYDVVSLVSGEVSRDAFWSALRSVVASVEHDDTVVVCEWFVYEPLAEPLPWPGPPEPE